MDDPTSWKEEEDPSQEKVDDPISSKKEKGLSQEAFDILLARLDPDTERAGHKYEDIRRKLIKFFECRGCPHPEEHADETFNRVAKRLSEGIIIQDIATYCGGVARLLVKEILRERERERSTLSEISLLRPEKEDQPEPDLRLECLEDCLKKLPDESRDLVIEYYKGEKHIENRKRLAQRRGIDLNTLRIRVHRIRAKLEECINDCLSKKMGR